MSVILVVDDEPAISGMVARALAIHGHSALTAASGGDALAIARSQQVDLLLTDIVMPGMSGVELSQRFLDEHPGTPVLYMTGYPEAIGLSAGPGMGLPLITKPFRTDALLASIAAALRSRTYN